jgi:hypothetical protein
MESKMSDTKVRTVVRTALACAVVSFALNAAGSPSAFANEHRHHRLAQGGAYARATSQEMSRAINRDALGERPRAAESRWRYQPGKGVIDEACDLPTSACPNGMRDVS